MLTNDQLDVIRATVVRVAAGYMDHPDAAMMARDVIKVLAPAPDGPPLLPAVGLPTDERALHDRLATGCLLRRGELCPCPTGEYTYDHCERIKVMG